MLQHYIVVTNTNEYWNSPSKVQINLLQMSNSKDGTLSCHVMSQVAKANSYLSRSSSIYAHPSGVLMSSSAQ